MPWYRTSPHTFPRDRWCALLDSVSDPSPYLLPEWTLLWESIWPRSTAELWLYTTTADDPIAAVPLVRRRRGGVAMCYAQPGGTPHGPLGDHDALTGDVYADLIAACVSPRTVEVAVSPDWGIAPPGGWISRSRQTTSWLVDLSGVGDSDIESLLSQSHRRNIAKGEECRPDIRSVRTPEDVQALVAGWQGSAHDSRFVLDVKRGSALTDAFASTGALVWRTAWCDDRPVASAIFLWYRHHAVYVDGAVDRDPAYGGVGHYLFAEILSELHRQGITLIDLGSGPGGSSDPGLEQFKRGWGATPQVRTEGIYRRRWYHTLRRVLGRE